MISAISKGNEDLGISKAVLKAMCCHFPPVVCSDGNKLVSGLIEQFEMLVNSYPRGLGTSSSSSPMSVSDVDLLGGSSGYNDGGGGGNDEEKRAIASFEKETVDSLEKREMTLKLMGNLLDNASIDASLLKNVRVIVKQQFQSMISFLKIRKRDWTEQGKSLKVRINAMLASYQAAARLQIKILASKRLMHGALDLLIKAAAACLFSMWRKLRACEELFSSLFFGISRVAVARDGSMLGFLFFRFKPLVLQTCAQSDTWGSNQVAMFETVLKTSCEIIQFGWYNNRSPVYTFITSILERNHYKEEAAPSLRLNIIRLLADLNFSVKSPEVVDMILPFFIESLEEGDASEPGLLRLRLLDAVARMASIGFEKAYREAVVLMTRSYLSTLAAVASAESKTTAPEATIECVETLSAEFLLIARDLTTPKLRSDYRHRLLSLCSHVGLASESKSGKDNVFCMSGADFLGPLLPAVAEICSDSDPTVDVEPSLLKLFRNLWFYVALFGLAPPLQNHHGMTRHWWMGYELWH